MASQTVHMSLSVRGALRWPKYRLKHLLRDERGRSLSPDEARAALMDALAQGHEMLPCGPCGGFDFKAGCPGHPSEVRDGE